jgi:hypothetical protein
MQGNFDHLQLQLIDTITSATEPKTSMSQSRDFSREQAPSTPSASELSSDWTSAFNTSLLTTRASHVKDRSQELSDLMASPEFASLLVGAKHLAETQGLSKEEATERLIEAFRKIDFAWKQIVVKRGLQAIIE